MKLIGILSWYDEPAWCLTELVASIAAAGADAIVAIDGAYALFPEGRAQSPSEQAQAILAAGQGAGIEVMLHCPREVWFGNEVEKRTFLFAAAHLIATPGEDWLWIIDGDERITEAIGLREALEKTECDVASQMMEMLFDGTREGLFPLRKFFRAQETGIRLKDNHFTYVTGDGRLLYEGYCVPKTDMAECEHLPFVRCDHRGGRSELRRYARQTYYDRRKEIGAELIPG